ncbi:MAG: hypothetical protein ACQES8_09670 [Thermodesulfobacteriota bacterium]
MNTANHKFFYILKAGIKIKITGFALLPMALLLLSSCAKVDPHQVDVELEKTRPEVKITSYSKSLIRLGRMSKIYDTGSVKIQSQDIADNTGASATTGGEIQRNITEIMKSTLNSMGGNVAFIEYDPSYIQNQMVTGYSDFSQKMIPDVVITGGITEFDRALITRGEGTDVSAEYNWDKLGSDLHSKEIGVEYGDSGKTGKARITLDFNMKNFQTLAGIPQMTVTNSMEVNKAVRQKELGITLFGPTFGSKGSIKKVQGRHEAVRLLVQASMIQLVGKYLGLPYWRLLGDDTQPDPVVTEQISDTYYQLDEASKTSALQLWLYLHGYDTELTGNLDGTTVKALQDFRPGYTADQGIDEELFKEVYMTIPITNEAYARREELNQMFAQMQAAPVSQAEQQVQDTAAQQVAGGQEATAGSQAGVASSSQEQQPATSRQSSTATVEQTSTEETTPVTSQQKGGFGRRLSEDEW